MSKIAVIGSGFSGLSAACYLAAAGHDVHVFEKNAEPGGRARQLKATEGFVFDMGPSWYWMPGVFERFFHHFGYRVADLYQLQLLDPAFEMVFGKDDTMEIPAGFEALCTLFESVEEGAASKLKSFMDEAALKYRLGMQDLVYKPALSITEYLSFHTIRNSLHTSIFSSFDKHVRKYFKHPRLQALMEFPVLFLGARPSQTPALYSLMNYAGLKLGTWYPVGGFGKVIDAMMKIAEEHKVVFHFNSPVEEIITNNTRAAAIRVKDERIDCEGVIASADYQHVEEQLLKPAERNYPKAYWNKKTMAPSSLIFYLGINKKIPRLQHHTLFFDESLDQHAQEIYTRPQWPTKPLFYACCPSKTDASVAPEGCENIFLLMPIAAGLEDNESIRENYFAIIIKRLEEFTGESILPHIVYKKSYCVNDFIADYHSYKGNAYGLANTLLQTAILKPKIRNRKIKNLVYAGQLTVPGPGVPPSIISGQIAAELLHESFSNRHEIRI